MRKFVVLCIALALLASCVPVYAADAADADALDVIKITHGDLTQIQLRDFALKAGYALEYDSTTNMLKISKDTFKVDYNYNQQYYVRDKNVFSLPGGSKLIEGRLYLSVDALSKLLGKQITVLNDGKVRVVPIPEDSAGKYSVEELTKMALSSDRDIIASKLDKTRAAETADRLKNNFDIHITGTGNTAEEAANASRTIAMQSAAMALDTADLSLKVKTEAVGIRVQTLVEKILCAQNTLKVLDATKALKEMELQRETTKNVQGLTSAVQLEKVKSELAALKEKVVAQKTEVQLNYDKLNKLAGMKSGTSYGLDSNALKMNLLGDINLEGHINSTLSVSPSIFTLEKQVEISKLSTAYYVYNYTGDSYKEKEIDVEKSKAALETGKVDTRKAMTEVYYKIRQLEANDVALNANIEKASLDLKTALANYQVGLITLYDVKQVELALEDLKNQKMSNVQTHETLRRTFEKPWISVND